jgi:hypothetical protein
LESGAVDDYLMPLLFRVGKGDEAGLLAYMRQDLRKRYGPELGEIVLLFMLRTYRHGGTDKLLALTTPAAA